MFPKEGLLTDEDCRIALRNYMATKDAKLSSFSIESLSSREGFMGQHFKVKIQYENNGENLDAQFFLKILNSSLQLILDYGKSMDIYEKEEFLYNFLNKEFNTNSIDTSFAPNCYMCRPYLLLLEDISLKGYKTTSTKKMLNIEHCKIALKSLAKFHTSAIVYEEIKSKEHGSRYSLFETYPSKFLEKLHAETAFSRWLKCTLQGIFQIIHFLPTDEVTAEMYRKKLAEEIETFCGLARPSKKYRNTIIHGDLWSNNIMFRYEGEAPADAILIDYQVLQYGTPALDVVELILKNVRRHLRLECYDELLMFYYENFCECLDYHGVKAGDILKVEDFLKSCDEVRLLNKMLATAGHSITFLADDVIEEAFKSEESIEKFFFHDRSEAMTLSYNNNDLYREIIQEDLIEIRDLLFC